MERLARTDLAMESEQVAHRRLRMGLLRRIRLKNSVIFVCSRWIAKKLDVFNQSFVTFVSLMFSVIWSLAMRSDISAVENAPDYGPAFDAVINLLLLAACILLYRFVIVALSRLTDKRRRMNMRMFIIPPAAFSLFYNIFSAVMAFRGYEANENLYTNILYQEVKVFGTNRL